MPENQSATPAGLSGKCLFSPELIENFLVRRCKIADFENLRFPIGAKSFALNLKMMNRSES